MNFLSTFSDKQSCNTSTTLQNSVAQFVSDSWASCSFKINNTVNDIRPICSASSWTASNVTGSLALNVVRVKTCVNHYVTFACCFCLFDCNFVFCLFMMNKFVNNHLSLSISVIVLRCHESKVLSGSGRPKTARTEENVSCLHLFVTYASKRS